MPTIHPILIIAPSSSINDTVISENGQMDPPSNPTPTSCWSPRQSGYTSDAVTMGNIARHSDSEMEKDLAELLEEECFQIGVDFVLS